MGYQVRRCHRRFDRTLNHRLLKHGLKTGYWYYLRALWIEDNVSQKYLSERTNVTETTTVAMINGMVKDGLVERVRDTVDRRMMRIRLTQKGADLEGKILKYAHEINRIALMGISKEDAKTCLSVLDRMAANLQEEFDATEEAEKLSP